MDKPKPRSEALRMQDDKDFDLFDPKMREAEKLIAAHPEIVEQINQLERALRGLVTQADDRSGNRVIDGVNKTDLMRALYYRVMGSQVKSIW